MAHDLDGPRRQQESDTDGDLLAPMTNRAALEGPEADGFLRPAAEPLFGESPRVQRKASSDEDEVEDADEAEEQYDSEEDEAEGEDAVAGTPAEEASVAEKGVRGPGNAMPHGAQIQDAFGRHDIGGVRAHEGDEAREANSELGAEAYAYGQDVAFGESPSLHTAAHEAAHTVQQRQGVARKSDIGTGETALETHADRVADAVVRGGDAEAVLDEMQSGNAGGQERSTAPQFKGKKKDRKKVREARAYEASFEDISSAAYGDSAALEGLDVAWIDDLDSYVKEEIDREFHSSKVDASFKKGFDKSRPVKALKKAFDADKQQIKTAAEARLKAAGIKRPKKKDLEADDAYVDAINARTDQYASDLKVARAEQRAAFDAEKVQPKAPMMAASVPKDGVTRIEGKMLARADFMSWGVLTLGSPDAVKAHFGAIKEVPGTSGMYLHAAAGQRYVAARSWFQNEYPGYTFHSTDVAMQLRNRHQEGHPQGKMGHPLGLSIDFKAYDNPNQLGDGVAQYMLRRFGGEDEDHPGENQIQTKGNPFSMTEEIGEATASGKELSKKQIAFLDSVEQGFNDMAATSKRFQESLKEDMPALREAETLWLEQGVPAAAKYRSAQDRLEKAREGAARRHAKEMKGLAAEEREQIIDGDDKVVAAQEAFDEVEAAFLLIKDQVTAAMHDVFEPWKSGLQGEVDAARGGIEESHLSLQVDVEQIDSLIDKLGSIKTRKKLDALLKKHEAAFQNLDATALPDDLSEARDVVREYLKEVRTAKWTEGELGVKIELIRRLESPWAVFGTESVSQKGTNRTKHKPTVSKVTTMQYLEDGFVRDDAMPEKAGAKVGGKSAQGVFNAKFVRCMTTFGFNTLATWSGVDTMHFDFREGFSAIQEHEFFSP